MQGSKEIVGMGKPGAVRVVRRDTHHSRKAFMLAVGNAHDERRFDEFEDGVETDNAVAWAEVKKALFPEVGDSSADPLKAALGQLVKLPVDSVSDTTNS